MIINWSSILAALLHSSRTRLRLISGQPCFPSSAAVIHHAFDPPYTPRGRHLCWPLSCRNVREDSFLGALNTRQYLNQFVELQIYGSVERVMGGLYPPRGDLNLSQASARPQELTESLPKIIEPVCYGRICEYQKADMHSF